MKNILFLILILGLFSCKQKTDQIKVLQNRIDNLEIKLNNMYKPGYGELMSNIQSHHSKLWFAGQNHNWKLAAFEIKELKEIIADILSYQKEREESKIIEMINPELDSIDSAVKQENLVLFVHHYNQLTNSCNNCHRLTNFEFNVVKVPDNSPFSNQDFQTPK